MVIIKQEGGAIGDKLKRERERGRADQVKRDINEPGRCDPKKGTKRVVECAGLHGLSCDWREESAPEVGPPTS